MLHDLPRIRDYYDLVRTMKMRRENLGWSMEEANERCGFEDNYYHKLELPANASGRSTLTPYTFGIVLDALGLELEPQARDANRVDKAKRRNKWKRHKSPKIKQLESNAKSRAYYARHRNKVRNRQTVYYAAKRNRKP